MGRAIDMEKDIDEIKIRLDIIEKALSRVIDVVEAMEQKGQQVRHIDLIEDVKPEEEVEVKTEDKPKGKKSGEKAKRPKKD